MAIDISTYALESAFTQAAASIKCPDCYIMLRNRIKEVIYQWSAVKVSAIMRPLCCCSPVTDRTILR